MSTTHERVEGHLSQSLDNLRTDELLLNMGPQHPSTHGVLRVVVTTDGEIVKAAKPEIGYLHRCFEKHSENREYLQVVPYTDRLDYVAAMTQELGYCLAVEKLLEVQIPERAQKLRVIVSELQRIASHLLAIGTYSLDTGGFAAFIYGFRDREHILRIFEELCGAR
ncbi:NADH-quinone oxidoreductase subunit D, partial [bacterium]|nr:NADH-quinone oxidoreductase subunit D [bacterium]